MPPRNRGKHPNDDKLFNQKWRPILKEAVIDLSYLLTKGYGINSALQLVGNRYRLNTRQQKALMRLSANRTKLAQRQAKALSPTLLQGRTVQIDGFNLLILLESALSGAYIFKCLDQTYRDISSVHGSYKRVTKSEEAIIMVGQTLADLAVTKVQWLLDAPVSNSGRLKTKLLEIATIHNFPWEVQLVNNPDADLVISQEIVITSDAWILDGCQTWFNLGAYLIDKKLLAANLIYAE